MIFKFNVQIKAYLGFLKKTGNSAWKALLAYLSTRCQLQCLTWIWSSLQILKGDYSLFLNMLKELV